MLETVTGIRRIVLCCGYVDLRKGIEDADSIFLERATGQEKDPALKKTAGSLFFSCLAVETVFE